jgi:hypothetical protein
MMELFNDLGEMPWVDLEAVIGLMLRRGRLQQSFA